MTESERQTWELERAKGRDSFILQGMWRRAWPFAVTFSVIYFLLEYFTGDLPSVRLGVWNCLVGIAMLTLGSGWCEGARIWYKREREYSEKA